MSTAAKADSARTSHASPDVLHASTQLDAVGARIQVKGGGAGGLGGAVPKHGQRRCQSA
eukprot:CAMPEP_0185197554 /NCGR_PEP_ID=MMETSP1140-20130426/40690_1 /TAXON_ID=298111 /ORGANISM="Pavlova sp., Strain CCMP459" /LENGTH=58 /DNA_ID=CAMNT_0027764683 /DNA_START=198 /DNA_END=371 /DNA_ORIENTATION=-